MLERTTYICEYCGEVFDTEEECIQHEDEEREKLFNHTIKLFDFNKKKISIPDAVKQPERVYAIYFSSTEMCSLLAEKFHLYNAEPGFYVWSDFYNAWLDPKAVIEEMQKYIKALEEAQKEEN
nr:MAG TPA: Monocytic leukemia zinc finger protein finger, acetyl transferase, DNA [Caudoviricetes sp.]